MIKMIRIVRVFLFLLLVNFVFSFDTSDQQEKEVNTVFKNNNITKTQTTFYIPKLFLLLMCS